MRQIETIEWRPFPEEKPEEDLGERVRFLITDIDGSIEIRSWGKWNNKTKTFVNGWSGIENEYVLAWANIPKGFVSDEN